MAEIPVEDGADAGDCYGAGIEAGGTLLRLRLALVVLRRMRGMIGVAFVFPDGEQIVIRKDVRMRIWVLMSMPSAVMVCFRSTRRCVFIVRVVSEGQVQWHQQRLHQQAPTDQDCEQSLRQLVL